MEKISIEETTKARSPKGVPFAKIKTGTGIMTAWDEDIIKTLEANVGREVMAEIKQSGKYANIRGVEEIKSGDVTDSTTGMSPLTSMADDRANSIISQVLVKCATRLLCPRITEKTTIKEMDNMAENAIGLTWRMYTSALSLLEYGE